MSDKNKIKESDRVKTKDIMTFLKDAFCVDGECRWVADKSYTRGGYWELTDSKRGKIGVDFWSVVG